MNNRVEIFEGSDQLLVCAQCGQEFIFEAGEQRFFLSKGLAPPKRCKACRDRRRATIVSAPVPFRNDFNHDGGYRESNTDGGIRGLHQHFEK